MSNQIPLYSLSTQLANDWLKQLVERGNSRDEAIRRIVQLDRAKPGQRRDQIKRLLLTWEEPFDEDRPGKCRAGCLTETLLYKNGVARREAAKEKRQRKLDRERELIAA